MTRAFVFPMLVAGILMLILGGGLFYGTWKGSPGFGASEIKRVDRTMAQYGTVAEQGRGRDGYGSGSRP